MQQIINVLTPYATVISSILSIAVLGLVLQISLQIRSAYRERISAAQERNNVLEERLKFSEDRFKQMVGVALGIKELDGKPDKGVHIHDIGDGFSGNIAGNKIQEGTSIPDSVNKLWDHIDHKLSILQTKLELNEERVEKINSLDFKITNVGAVLGIDQFKKDFEEGVRIRDIGDDFRGKIAGRDILETINKIGEQINEFNQTVNNSNQQISNIIKDSSNMANSMVDLSRQIIYQIQNENLLYQYKIEMIYDRNPAKLSEVINSLAYKYSDTPWRFYAFIPAYEALDGCILLLRCPTEQRG